MAIYHLSVKPVSRGGGRSATAAAAYRAAERVHDVSTGQDFDYTHKLGVAHTEIVLPTSAAEQDVNWARDRQQLWNAAEQAENRSNSRVAREYEIALPQELTRAQRITLTREFAAELANRHGVAVDLAIHAPHWAGDQRNWHAHLLATTRTVEPGGLGEKATIEWSDANRRKAGLEPGKEEIKAIRERWAELTNEHLRELGLAARVDHRSLKAQGIEREPTCHKGPAVSGMERRGLETEVGHRMGWERQVAAQRQLAEAQELGRLEREASAVRQSILELSLDLRAAKRERTASRALVAGKAPEHTPGLFDGLTFKSSARTLEREALARIALPARQTVLETAPEIPQSWDRALDRYARAWTDAARMPERNLPVLEHQKTALREASAALDGLRPGASADLSLAITHEPLVRQVLTTRQGRERTVLLQSALEHERRVRSEPELKAERLVKVWEALETDRERLVGPEHRHAKQQVRELEATLVAELKRDPQLESLLQRRSQDLGIQPGSRLDRVLKAPTLERALQISGPDRGRDYGHEL